MRVMDILEKSFNMPIPLLFTPLKLYRYIKAYRTIKHSQLFDANYYLLTYPDIRYAHIDPIKHYIFYGANEGRNPNPTFDTQYYLQTYQDVQKSGMNPLYHYIRYGKDEERTINQNKKNSTTTHQNAMEYFNGKEPFDTNKKSILLVAHMAGAQLFGGERSFLDVIRGFHALKKYNLVVALPIKENRKYIDTIEKYTHKVVVTYYRPWKEDRPFNEEVALKMSNILLSNRIDIVYVNTITIVEALIAAKRLGKFTLTHIRELISDDEGLCQHIGKSSEEIIKLVHARSDFMIANSQTTLKTFELQDKIAHVPNIIELEKFTMENRVGKTIKIGIISSNIPKKGLDDFVHIAQRCYERGMNDLKFIVIGPQNDSVKEYEQQLKNKKLHNNIAFLGYYDNPQEAIAEINILLSLSSFAESFGRTIAEALAAKRPVISYPKGATHELVRNNETGFLVAFQDFESICEKIEYFRQNRAKIIEFGQNGHRLIAQNFAQKNLNEALGNVFEALDAQYFSKFKQQRTISVVVPIYNAYDEVKTCLEYLEYYTNFAIASIILINDGSSDKRIEALIAPYDKKEHFEVLTNEENIGYTKTINRAIKHAKANDIILLNSDTIVTPYWVEGLLEVAYGQKKVGTVTAMSNNAGAFSFPIMGQENKIPEGLSYESYAMELIQKASSFEPIEVPTGSGFCLYITRELIDTIGLFDAQLFPRGYGEENDFCMRGLKSGYKNFISTYCYIYHARSASFKEEKEALVAAGLNRVIEKYPEYTKLVQEAFHSKQMQTIRNAMQE